MKKLFTLCLLFTALLGNSQSTTVVISQVYGGGGATTGSPTYKPDYVELFNKSLVSQDISGFQVMYGSSTGQFGSSASNFYVIPANTIIPARKYLLIQCGTVGTVGADLPVLPDLTTTNMNMSGTSGKVALVTSAFTGNTCGATATPCTIPSSNIIDLVAYGAANNAEGGTSVNNGVAITSVQGAVRKLAGMQDTDNNNADFDVITAPVPRNSSAPAPLTLNSFKASLIGGKASLTWNTTNEINVAGFAIEKSSNGSNYSQIDFVAGKNATANSYNYTDATAITGTTYYRLKMADKDGSFKYSNVVAINAKQSIKLDVFPNPVVSTAILSHTKASHTATIKVVTLEGRTLATYNVQDGATQTSIDVSKLSTGTYVLVFDNNGNSSFTKMVKL